MSEHNTLPPTIKSSKTYTVQMTTTQMQIIHESLKYYQRALHSNVDADPSHLIELDALIEMSDEQHPNPNIRPYHDGINGWAL